jgi:hypothetical protein
LGDQKGGRVGLVGVAVGDLAALVFDAVEDVGLRSVDLEDGSAALMLVDPTEYVAQYFAEISTINMQ